MPEFSADPTTNIGTSSAMFNAFQAESLDSPTGAVNVAMVTFEAVGEPGSESVIDIAVETLSDTDGDPISAKGMLSTVTISEEDCLPEDVNCDRNVDAVDLQLVINEVLGLPVDPVFNPDVTRSGEVNAQDIQRVINYILGNS